MGEHDCVAPPSAETTPAMPAPSLFERFNPWGGGAAAEKQQPRAPPQVDTSAASTLDASRAMAPADDGLDRAYMGQGQLTPVSSLSSGSQQSEQSVSPKTPNPRPGAGSQQDELFAPQIANDSPPPQQSRRPGGYGGLGDRAGYDEPPPPLNLSRKQGPNLMDRMNAIAPGPFDSGRRPSTRSENNDRPGTSASNSGGSMIGGQMPKMPRKNGYGGFGPPVRSPSGREEPPLTPSRADTFPRASEGFPPPLRTPSAPPAALTLRVDQLRPPSDSAESADGRASPISPGDSRGSMMSDRSRRPSRGPDTSRPPPPRSASIRPTTPGVPTINLAEEFGIGNPYHAPSESTVSSVSDHSRSERRPSQASSRTSPPRSLASRSGRRPSDTSSFDNLMSDIQTSMNGSKPKPSPLPLSPLKLARDGRSPLSARPPRSDRGYDPRIDPAIQNPRLAPGTSPIPSPIVNSPLNTISAALSPGAVLSPSAVLSPASAVAPSPRWTGSSQRTEEQQIPSPSREIPPERPPLRERQPSSEQQPRQIPPERPPMNERQISKEQLPREIQLGRPPLRDRQPSREQQPRDFPREPPRDRQSSRDLPRDLPSEVPLDPRRARDPREAPRDAKPARERSRSRPRNLPVQTSRGDCKSCGLPIKGKSISSADGRLTGRYHKPCFVCSTCREPFSSATFYVLDDRPYCELHYHKLNGSLCGSCGNGIEGQYLEDEAAKKHHVGCFKCGDCGMALKDGYFEVNGKAFCEKDAWRRVQQPWVGGRGGMRPPGSGGPPMGLPGMPRSNGPGGGGYGGPGPYGASRLGPGPRPRMEKRMTRLGML
ncbi:hypothetical protein QBC35DRAFT_448131 [Podospora australis]|uniref:LIM zinc-binding domain-containing protein n=1 Tax=Podospora australis TaxID=1536484 RepID=A0AAN6X0D3_9PEZI|nr:hypothetical protein QBC35DRAFT_448131 [Podospora australis]